VDAKIVPSFAASDLSLRQSLKLPSLTGVSAE